MAMPTIIIIRGFFNLKGPKNREVWMEVTLFEGADVEKAKRELQERWPSIKFTRFEKSELLIGPH